LAVLNDSSIFELTFPMLKYGSLLFFLLFYQLANGQRNYVPNSVLRTGDWFKISLKKEGIYKIDYRFLESLGVPVKGISSSSIRLYGNGGAMLPEKVSATVADDLQENAIEVVDGGDGIFDPGDYFLFYATGPHIWFKDSVSRRFVHQQNIYSDQSFYFISIGGTGKRITSSHISTNPSAQVNSYNDRYYYEPDSLNLLSSGKNWFGAEFNNKAGGTNRRNFAVPFNDLETSEKAVLVSSTIGRAIGAGSVLTVKQNQSALLQHNIEGVTPSSYDLFARTSTVSVSFPAVTPLVLQYDFTSGGFGAQGWLDWFEVFARRKLVMTAAEPLFFRDWNSIGSGDTAQFTITGASGGTVVWDITNRLSPVKQEVIHSGNQITFKNDCSILREYVTFSGGFSIPHPVGKIRNQDLHQAGAYDLLIVTHPLFIAEANRLATFHLQQDHLTGLVATTDQLYNEFASGSPDPVAIRNFVKMYYDRAGQDSSRRPKYLLLFGDASFDYKNKLGGNSNLLPAYQSNTSLDPLSSYTSDDFFGFLDDNEDINDRDVLNLLDIGIGRIPARTVNQAKNFVDKVISYKDTATLGSWRNQLTFIADDEDFNLHLQDAETVSDAAASVNDLFIQNKIYLDAFRQESNASGSRYPLVNKEIKDKVETGNLILNYNGHGGFRRLAEEVVLDQEILNEWYNPQRLPLFITATCDFTPYDNPAIYSLGEDMLLREETGAIALMTTTRLVFAYSNRVINEQYLQTALSRKADGSYRSLGDAVREAKNNTYTSFSDITNNRKFTLLGDPALTLNFPRYKVETTEINGRVPTAVPDTLKAFDQVFIKGEIKDEVGKLLTGFNGEVEITVFDKPESQTTLVNDPSSLKQNFLVQERVLFKGNTTVSAGKFSFRFIVPKDIHYKAGNGRISYYAQNGVTDANGSFTAFVISGSAIPGSDVTGPVMQGWLENFQFKNGQTVSETPLLLLKLTDSSGINITGDKTGHEISATLDGDTRNRLILNDWFRPDKDSYQQGTVSFRLPVLKEGKHELRIKSWDNGNNSGDLMLNFQVRKDQQLLEEIMNFPNPLSTGTRFCITHKRPGERLQAYVHIFTPHGQLIKSLSRTINTPLARSCEIQWDGLDAQGRKLKQGIYIYKVEIQYADGTRAIKSKKLIVM
jgi:hypothetical protein